MFGQRGKRYERRRQARARRVQRRLEQVQRSRGTRGAPRSLRAQLQSQSATRSRAKQLTLFAASLFFGSLLASTVTATALQWWNEKPATLESIAVQGSDRLSSEEIARSTGLIRGSRLENVSEAELTHALTTHPWIREARVAVLPTGTLIVDVTERQAEAVLRDDSGLHFVDREGVAFAGVDARDEAQAAELPLLVGNDSNAKSRRNGLAIAAQLAGLALPGIARNGAPHRGIALQLDSQLAGHEGWVLRPEHGPVVILGSDEPTIVAKRLVRLQQLLEAELSEITETTLIDMRFAGQAVLRDASTSRRGAPSGVSARMREGAHNGMRRRSGIPALARATGG